MTTSQRTIAWLGLIAVAGVATCAPYRYEGHDFSQNGAPAAGTLHAPIWKSPKWQDVSKGVVTDAVVSLDGGRLSAYLLGVAIVTGLGIALAGRRAQTTR